MADEIEISNLPLATSLTGDEYIPIVQFNGITLETKKTTFRNAMFPLVYNITTNTLVSPPDFNALFLINSASPITVTLPDQPTYPLTPGFNCYIHNINTGTFTVETMSSDTITGNLEGDQGSWMQVFLKSTNAGVNAWATAGGTSIEPVTYPISFYDIAASVDGYPMTPLMEETTTLTALEHQCDSGSLTYNLLQGGSTINGGTITTNTTRTVTSLTSNNVVAIGSFVKLTATSVTSPKNTTLLLRGTVRRS